MLHIVISSSSQVFSETVGSALVYCTIVDLVKLEFAINKSRWILRISLWESHDSGIPVDKGFDCVPGEELCNVGAIGCIHLLQKRILNVGKVECSELGVVEVDSSSVILVWNHILDLKIVRFSLVSHPGLMNDISQIVVLFRVFNNGTGCIILRWSFLSPAFLPKIRGFRIAKLIVVVFHIVRLSWKCCDHVVENWITD